MNLFRTRRKELSGVVVADPQARGNQEFRDVVRAWASATRAMVGHASFTKWTLMILLYIVASVGVYNMYIMRNANNLDNEVFYHRQWVPGIALDWGWQTMPGWAAHNGYTIAECLSTSGRLTEPVPDTNCNVPGPDVHYHGFPFSIADGTNYNSVAEAFNNVVGITLAGGMVAVLWYKFLRRSQRALT